MVQVPRRTADRNEWKTELIFITMNYFAMFDKFDVDGRQPGIPLHVPFLGKIALALPYASFWIESFLFLILQACINVLVATALYTLVFRNAGTSQAYIIGYGLICPVVLYLPFTIVPFFDIQNVALLLCLCGGMPAVLFFRCLETMHGTLPVFATQSYFNFIAYNAFTLQFTFHPITNQPNKVTRSELINRIALFLRIFLECTLLYSILLPRGYKLFDRKPIESVIDLYRWPNIANNFAMALLTSRMLEAGSIGLGILASFCFGLSMTAFNDNPLFGSTSVSDFWGKRWNKIIEMTLRRGVYRPLRNAGLSASFAAFATFVASGFLHEFELLMMTLRGGIGLKPYVPSFGPHLFFFAWNGLMLMGEHTFAQTPLFAWIGKHLPRPLRTFSILMLVLPVSHLFTDEYIASGFYSDAAVGFPKIQYLGQSSTQS